MSGATALKAGTRLRSSISSAEVLIVRPPARPVELTCGGAPLIGIDDGIVPPGDGSSDGEEVSLGKRYFDEGSGLELLCTKPGTGALACDGRLLQIREPKPLPSSD